MCIIILVIVHGVRYDANEAYVTTDQVQTVHQMLEPDAGRRASFFEDNM